MAAVNAPRPRARRGDDARARTRWLARSSGEPSSWAHTRRWRWGTTASGPNHVLPTGGSARFSSPLSVRDFQRRQSLVRHERARPAAVADGIVRVARAEGFPGHAQSVLTRFAGMSDPLLHVKPAVRAAAAYTLAARRAPVKINQNENPFDVPEEVKRRVLERPSSRSWSRYPDFDPKELREKLCRVQRVAGRRDPVRQRLERADRGAAAGDGGRGHARGHPRADVHALCLLTSILGGEPVRVRLDPRARIRRCRL